MNSSDIWKVIFILILFAVVLFLNVCVKVLVETKHKWGNIKCNPMIIPLSSWFGYDPREQFDKCISSHLESKEGVTPDEKELIDGVMNDIDCATKEGQTISASVEEIQEKLDNNASSLSHIFGVVGTEFQRTGYKIKDSFDRIQASINGMYNAFQHGTNAGIGITSKDSPIVQMVDFVDNIPLVCFHPDTLVPCKNNTHKRICDIVIGEELLNNVYVIATMKILGNSILNENGKNDMYGLYSEKMNQYIYVTAHHIIEYEGKNTFIKDHPNAKHYPNMNTNILFCLVTSNQKIEIGEYTFKDWESHSL